MFITLQGRTRLTCAQRRWVLEVDELGRTSAALLRVWILAWDLEVGEGEVVVADVDACDATEAAHCELAAHLGGVDQWIGRALSRLVVVMRKLILDAVLDR